MKRTVTRVGIVLCAGISLCLMGGCPFQVVFPQALQTTSQDFELDGNKIKITVVFNKDVDISSLIGGTNVILVTERDSNANVTIAGVTATATTVVITSVDDYADLLIFDSDGFFSLQLLGSGSNPIMSSDGETLDGDADGSAGGDYETGFVIIG